MNISSLLLLLIPVLIQCGSEPTTNTLSGLPDQDPIIDQLRQEFRLSESPSESQLALNQVWHCYFRSAYRNDFRESKDLTYLFHKSGAFYENRGNTPVTMFVRGANGFAGNAKEFVLTFRISTAGSLIGEWSAGEGFFTNPNSVPAIATPKRRAHGYETCQLAGR